MGKSYRISQGKNHAEIVFNTRVRPINLRIEKRQRTAALHKLAQTLTPIGSRNCGIFFAVNLWLSYGAWK
jgi:hypothetical protein